jgi:hypothetical protein
LITISYLHPGGGQAVDGEITTEKLVGGARHEQVEEHVPHVVAVAPRHIAGPRAMVFCDPQEGDSLKTIKVGFPAVMQALKPLVPAPDHARVPPFQTSMTRLVAHGTLVLVIRISYWALAPMLKQAKNREKRTGFKIEFFIIGLGFF